jgi:hypothetical protein
VCRKVNERVAGDVFGGRVPVNLPCLQKKTAPKKKAAAAAAPRKTPAKKKPPVEVRIRMFSACWAYWDIGQVGPGRRGM